MKNIKRNGKPGNKNAYKGEYSIDYMYVCELRDTLSFEKISKELGIPRTTLIRRYNRWIECGKSLGYTIE